VTPLIVVCEILLRFCLHCYALSTDIENFFLHVKLDERDRNFTRFLWSSNPDNPESPFITYQFKVILFGSSNSAFTLSAILHHHLDKCPSAVSKDIKHNLYVDNVISGCQSEDEIQTTTPLPEPSWAVHTSTSALGNQTALCYKQEHMLMTHLMLTHQSTF